MNDEPSTVSTTTPTPAPLETTPGPGPGVAGPEVQATAETEPRGVLDALARLPDKALVTENGLADLLHMNKRTIRRMVSRHELPPPVRFAGHSTWLAGGVISHFQARAERAAREAERQQRKSQEI